MRFEPNSIYFLAALVLLPLIWWRWLQRRPESALRFSAIAPLLAPGRGFGARVRHVIPVLRTLAVGLLIVCLARPEKGNEQTRIFAEGIAIQMVVDLSGSMEQEDYVIDRRRATRLDAVKKVFREFVQGESEDGGDGRQGRPDDLIGLIGFARYADSLAPLTLDHKNVLTILDESETVWGPAVQQRRRQIERAFHNAQTAGDQRRMRQLRAEYDALEEENTTAIGDAMALAVERLRDLDRRLALARRTGRSIENKVKSKVMILLTDGESNAGELTPAQAAELAKAYDIKIYAIGIGAQARRGAIVDEEQMRQVAETTEGRYFRANDTRALKQVYAEIDELEKTETQEQRFLQHKLLATNAVHVKATGMASFLEFRLPPLLAVVIVLLALEIVLANTRLRRIP
ncbi:MAG: VWA domain-containing protein [bacterium]|nr:VWA domain-containing protein [bacterium]